MNTGQFVLLAGSVYGLLGVLLGAFGAHAMQDRLSPEMLRVWETAVQYQFWHALALLAVGLLAARLAGAWLNAAGVTFALGVLVFSGSLYALALTGVRLLGAVTPFGGLLLIAGWLCLAVAVWRG
ncbi:DUF423 domain-containing protein [Spectribacter hydrogenoxidans]|uniref:DUF423 domain-containing protein n=1 Tax=Spectribacter hydrogenoxidans TaxID=3075608 RepID=A0ABU3BZQ5_9GAMM|nr:DUF423 domain-containing protein [Salinisphaera sp. W335]MDT0634594.1 DUF423 domain-containing protein [Salinisphaera sp. W335]